MKIMEWPVNRLQIVMVDKPKTQLQENEANAGYFANYDEGEDKFTLPVGHLICDYEADDQWTRKYCEERGSFEGEKFRFDNSKWEFDNKLYGTKISTLVVKDGAAKIIDTVELPDADYAVSGVPVLRNGADCKWGAYVTKQGWSSSAVRPTWHTFVGVKDDPSKVYVIGMKTTSDNMVKTSEAFNVFRALGFRDVIKLDGGGSFYMNAGGEVLTSGGSRRINSILRLVPESGTGKKPFKIALDAGHGLTTPGRRIPKELNDAEVREWQLNSRVANKTEQLLGIYDNVEVLRVDDRTGQTDVSLDDRTNAANQWGADVYISIHANAGINGGSGGGIVAYAHTEASAESINLRDALYYELVATTGLRGNRATPRATANHHVTRETNMTAVLLELGFMDSKADVPVILTEAFADGCAAAIVDALADFYGLTETDTIDTADEWAQRAWERAYAAGVMDGTRPRDGVSRQEMAVVLDKLGMLE